MYRELVAMDALGELASTASTAAGFTARAIEEIGNILPSQAELASLIPRLSLGTRLVYSLERLSWPPNSAIA